MTFFFNGGREAAFALEDRAMEPSPKEVATYDLKPEMNCAGVAQKVCLLLKLWWLVSNGVLLSDGPRDSNEKISFRNVQLCATGYGWPYGILRSDPQGVRSYRYVDVFFKFSLRQGMFMLSLAAQVGNSFKKRPLD